MNEQQQTYLTELFPPGTRVELKELNDPYTKIPRGTLGTVTDIDCMGTIHVKWDSGHRLGLIWGEDSWTVPKEDK